MGGQPIGASQFLARVPRGPKISHLEMKLLTLGMPIQKFRRFSSVERFHITPASGCCYWGGVPYYLKQGTTHITQSYFNVDLQPSNGDLFDAAAKIQETLRLGNGGGDNGGQNMSLDKLIRSAAGAVTIGNTTPFDIRLSDGQAISSLTAAVGLGTGQQVREWVVKANDVSITMENTSTLDAFVEQYELTYTMPKFGLTLLNRDRSEQSYASFAAVFNRVIGTPAGTDTFSTLNTGLVTNYPNCFDVRNGVPAEPGVYPEAGVDAQGYDVRKYGGRLSGQMLESYASIAANHRPILSMVYPTSLDVPNRAIDSPMASIAYAASFAATGSVVTATAAALAAAPQDAPRRPTIREMLCHPMNDPTKLYPIGVKNTSGFHLKRLPGQIILKPGASRKITLPVKKGFTLDVDDFLRVVEQEIDSVLTGSTDYRDVVELPKTCTIRFFRVRGDMIQSKTSPALRGDTDYQTGSCTVVFQVMRSFWMRSVSQLHAKECSPLNAFDAFVSIADQEAINDETDAPAPVDATGL